MAKNVSDEILISALINHATIKKAAEAVGLTERAVYARMKQPEFKVLYREVQNELLNNATARLQNFANGAISALAVVMCDKDNSPQSRVCAADAVLRYCLKYTEQKDLAQRVDTLEAAQDSLSKSLEELGASLESDEVV